MALSDIAAGIEVTTTQRERSVPTVDGTDLSLEERLATYADALPCSPAAATTVLRTYASGTDIDQAAAAAGVAPMTAAKTLHRCGEPGVSPLGPTGRQIVRDWCDGTISRADAMALTGGSETAFALAAYIEAHDAIPELVEAAEAALTPDRSATVEKRDALAETMTDATEFV